MYIKYREIEGKEIAILDVHSVRIVRDYDEGGFFLVPNWSERELRMADAVVSRLAALSCGLPAVQDRIRYIQRKEECEFYPVFSQMYPPDPYQDCIVWYSTLEEANATVEKVAAAIAQGDRLYDLTEGHGDGAQ